MSLNKIFEITDIFIRNSYNAFAPASIYFPRRNEWQLVFVSVHFRVITITVSSLDREFKIEVVSAVLKTSWNIFCTMRKVWNPLSRGIFASARHEGARAYIYYIWYVLPARSPSCRISSEGWNWQCGKRYRAIRTACVYYDVGRNGVHYIRITSALRGDIVRIAPRVCRAARSVSPLFTVRETRGVRTHLARRPRNVRNKSANESSGYI